MAFDPVTLQSVTPATAPAGTIVCTDDLGGTTGRVQYIKLMDGTDGSALVIPGNTSQGLLVNVSQVQGTVTVDTELGAAGALSDGMSAAPTVVPIGSHGLVYNPALPGYVRQRGDGSGTWVQGPDAHGVAVTGDPVPAGYYSSNAAPTPVASDGLAVRAWGDRRGALNVIARTQTSGVNLTVPGIVSGTYASGDQVGTKMTGTAVSSANYSASLVGAVLTDLDRQLANLELWLFQSDPTFGAGDNAAWDGTDTNLGLAKPFGVIDFSAANYRTAVAAAICVGTTNGGVPYLPYISPSGNLYAFLVTRGTPTYNTGNLSIQLFVTLD